MTRAEVTALPEGLSCEETEAYVERNGIDLPVSYEYVRLMPVNFAKLAIGGINEFERLKLWQDHVRATAPTLRLAAIESDVVDRFLSIKGGLKKGRVADLLIVDIERRTRRETAYYLFADLGLDPRDGHSNAAGEQVSMFSSSRSCTCSQTQDFCSPVGLTDAKCVPSGCTNKSDSCGWFWMADCTGECDLAGDVSVPSEGRTKCA